MVSKSRNTIISVCLFLALGLFGWAVYRHLNESYFRQAVTDINKANLNANLEVELPEGLKNDADLKELVRLYIVDTSEFKIMGYTEIDPGKRLVQVEIQTLRSEYFGELANILSDLRSQNKKISHAEIKDLLTKKIDTASSLRSLQKNIVVQKQGGNWEEVP